MDRSGSGEEADAPGTPEPAVPRSEADVLLRLHDELDLLAPSRGASTRIRDGVIVGAAAYASWMILDTAAGLGAAWPFGVVLTVGWAVSIGISVARRLRIRALRRRIAEAEGGNAPSGQIPLDEPG